MHKILSKCPVCGEAVYVTEIACGACHTRVQSAFDPCRFCRLTPEQLQFVELFLRTRGNLSSVGGELGLSYPTVAKRLDAVLATLGLDDEEYTAPAAMSAPAPPPVPPTPPVPPSHTTEEKNQERRRILEMLDRGEISADDATRRLRDL